MYCKYCLSSFLLLFQRLSVLRHSLYVCMYVGRYICMYMMQFTYVCVDVVYDISVHVKYAHMLV
jgi:hypothetical protein